MSGSNPYHAAAGARDRVRARPQPPAAAVCWRIPPGFWFFFWGEFAERCSYYGMRAILLLYMIDRLQFGDAQASVVMSYFMAACYFLPLVGGYLADHYFGKYRTIVAFSLPYIIGQVILGIENKPFLFIALSLLAMGSGVIKPNISTLMGLTYDQQRPGQTKLRSDAFAIFYGAINIGAAISSFAMPWLRDQYGYQTAFLCRGGPDGRGVRDLRRRQAVLRRGNDPGATTAGPQDRRQRLVVLRRIFGLFIVVAFFWSIFDQSATTWTLFARDHLDLNFFGLQLTPDQIQGLNPILILLLLPPITMLWHLLARLGLELRPTDKMLIGFVLTGADDGHHVGGRLSGRRDGPGFALLGGRPLRADHHGRSLHLGGRPGTGLRRGPALDEELRHRLLAADGLPRRQHQRLDYALVSVH